MRSPVHALLGRAKKVPGDVVSGVGGASQLQKLKATVTL